MAQKNTQPAPSVDSSGYSAGQSAPNGTKVKIRKGQVPDQDGTTTIESAEGLSGRVDGDMYVAKGGPNRGKLMQPVRVDGRAEGERLLSVPVENVALDRGGSKSRGNFTTGFRSADQHAKVFGGKKPEERWVEVRPGVKRLVKE